MMKLKLKSRYIALFLSVLLISAWLVPIQAEARMTKNYVYNEYAEAVNAPSSYICKNVLRGRDIGLGDFSEISDIYVNKNIYIADSGNNRIVILDSDYKLVRIIESVLVDGERSSLKRPSGVFLFNNLLYICDTANARVIAIDESDNVRKTYVKPKTDLMTEDFEFKPSRVVVNSAGSVYIMANGVYQGLLHYENDGTFIEFFGANKVTVTPSVIIKSIWMNIFSEEQRESLIRTVPTEYSGIFIDDEDMVYTTTSTAKESQVKRLNASGENILIFPGSSGGFLQKGYDRNNFGDQQIDSYKGGLKYSEIIDVDVDEDGVIAVLDAQHGRVFLYDSEQNQLGIFGGTGTQDGLFKKVSAIGKNHDDYLIADYSQNAITVFKPTKYMQNIRSALQAYSSGNYTESREYWYKVFDENAGLSVAAKSIGRTLLLEGNYEDSMEYLKMGDDRYYYSMALTRYRREFLRENTIWLLPCSIGLIVGFVVILKKIYKAILKSDENNIRRDA